MLNDLNQKELNESVNVDACAVALSSKLLSQSQSDT